MLWRIGQRPVVLRVSLVYFCFEFVLNSFYIFMDDYLTSRFASGVLQTSIAMMIFGACLALASAVLVSPLGARFTRRSIVMGATLVMAASIALFIVMPGPILAYLPIVPIGVAFALGYPTLLGIYSASVDEQEQGWVMGVSIALFSIGSALTSLIGGALMGYDLRLPFLVAIGVAVLASA